MAPSLLEREDEIAALFGAADAAVRNDGQVILLGGEAGGGKSSLVRLLRDHYKVVTASCEPLSVPAPLAPVRELAPGLSGLHADDHVVLALGVLACLSRAGPLVAVVEDAHWADPATLDVLRAVARRIEGRPVSLVVTYRDDEFRANVALTAFVGDLATVSAVRRFALRPLSEEAVRVLAEPAGADASEIVKLTGGNPFLVVETIAATDRLPATVRDAILARVARLDSAARTVVEAAAILGPRVPLGLLREVEPYESAALEAALGRGVLVDDGGALAFRHELTRQAIEESISTPRAVELHARAVRALGGGEPARLAHHAERAGLLEDAARYAERAASAAEQVGALAEASSQLERALRVPAAASARFELLLRYVRVTNFAGGLEQARAAAEEALQLSERELDAGDAGRALAVLSWSLWSLDRVEEARSAAERAVAALEARGDGDYASALAAWLRMESIAFDPATVVAEAPRVFEVVEAIGSEEARVDVAISLGLAQAHLGDRHALDTLLAALEDAKASRLPFQTIRAYVNAVDVAAELRSHAVVDRIAKEALERLETFQTAIPRQTVLLSVARSLLDRGRFGEAVDWARAARRDEHGGVALALGVEGIVCVRQGRDGGALLEQASASLAGVPEGWRHAVLRAWRAEAAWVRGDFALIPAEASGSGRPAAELDAWIALANGRVRNDWRNEIERWTALEAPYEAALAALPGDERAASRAVAVLKRLGANGAARAFVRERGRLGFGTTRGPRPSTLTNAAGLTRREQEVLAEVARGATNHDIATTLHLSERTVSHHVSAILAKLQVPTRTAAVDAARRIGLLKDGTEAGPR